MIVLLTVFLGLIHTNGIFAQTPSDCNASRDNDNFINWAFWELNPTDNNIVCALYGAEEDTSTAYTNIWTWYTSWSCLLGMTVVYTWNIPELLTDNTIYVIESWSYDISTGTSMANCSAIISSGNVLINKIWAFNMIYSDRKNNTILDSIHLNGSWFASNGIYINLSGNSTINNVETYNNAIWISLNSANYVTINNSISHNNTHGIYTNLSSNNIITGSKTHNNSQHWLYLRTSQYNVFDNIEITNNWSNHMWIFLFSSSHYNLFNNINSHHQKYWIEFYISSYNIIQNSNFHNNKIGIGIEYFSNHNTFKNVNIYNQWDRWIILSRAQYNTFEDINIYNNTKEWLLLWSENDTKYNTFNNIHTYNNSQWISMEGWSTYNSFNNILSHNNNIGILLINYANRAISNNIYNNIQIYNNNVWLETQLWAKNNIYNNIQIYNNTTGTNMNILDIGNTYYGEIRVFWNGDGNILGNGDNFVTGYSSTNTWITRNTWEIFLTGNLSWDLFTNAISTSGNYLLSRSGTRSDSREKQIIYSWEVTQANSYGSGISLQIQPVIWSWTTDLITWWIFDTTKYIWSDTVKSSGSLSELNVFSAPNITVYWCSDDSSISYYSLFWDIYEAQTDIVLNTTQEITFLSGDWEKRIVTQLFWDNNFATHFQNTTLLDQTPPNQVTLILPISWSTLTTSNIHLSWDIATDTGAWINRYIFEVLQNNETILSGNTIQTWTDISLPTNGNYERKIYPVDMVWNITLTSETWNFTINLPSSPTWWWGGGWWGWILIQDQCSEDRDCSNSYYDKICGPCPVANTWIIGITWHESADEFIPWSIIDSPYWDELNDAYLWAYTYGITTIPTIQRANIQWTLIRKDMAKMITNFAVNVLEKDISTGILCEFSDTTSLPKVMQYYIMAACRLWLMWYESDGVTVKKNFEPEMVVDRAQFWTILSRLLRENKNDNGKPYYIKHLNALVSEGIITKTKNPFAEELRGRVMIMMQRTFQNK